MSRSKESSRPSLVEEDALWAASIPFVIGIDEAGRGCLAGPVCVGAFLLRNQEEAALVSGEVRDSKQMEEGQRERLFDEFTEKNFLYGVGFASAKEIDRWNILRATYLATARAVENVLARMRVQSLDWRHEQLAFLSDGSHPLLSNSFGFLKEPAYQKEFPQMRELFKQQVRERPIIKGDSKVLSIAAASIFAKVSRDRYMRKLHAEFPAYEFMTHKGYSTAMHVRKLNESGPCSEHRMTFSPVAQAAKRFQV